MRIPIASLKMLTLLYVSFVLFPFFLGYMRPAYGLPCLAVLGFGYYKFYQGLDFSIYESVGKTGLFAGLGILIVWMLFSGAGGMGFQQADHIKNNVIENDLSSISWPVSYLINGERMYLSHYFGYYLPGPALVGFLGYKYAQLFLFFYATLGAVLGFLWLWRFAKGGFGLFIFLLIVFGGLSFVSLCTKYGGGTFAELIHRIKDHGYPFWLNSWEVIPLNYMPINDMMYWAPQHAIPTFIGIGIILNSLYIDKEIKYLPFQLSLLLMWSPLTLVGLFPFMIFALWKMRFKGVFNPVNLLVAPVIFLVVASFILSIESNKLVKHFIFLDLSAHGVSLIEQIAVYWYFLLMEVFVWVLVIWLIVKKKFSTDQKSLLIFTAVLLTLIPLYRFGLWNDWCNRVSMPSTVVLAVLTYQAFVLTGGFKRYLMVGLYLLGSLGFVIGFGGSVYSSGFRPRFNPPGSHQLEPLPEIEKSMGFPISQFVAPEDAFFFKYLAKKPK